MAAHSYKDARDFFRCALEILLMVRVLFVMAVECKEVRMLGFRRYFRSLYADRGSHPRLVGQAHASSALLTCRAPPLASYNLTDWIATSCLLASGTVWVLLIQAQYEAINGFSLLDSDGEGAVRVTDALLDAEARWKEYTFLNICNIFLALITVLKIFESHDRLSLVTSTISSAKNDLIFFFIVYLVVTGIFMCIGHLLLGSRMANWSTLGDSFNSLFDLQLGDVTYTEIKDQALEGQEDFLA